MNLHVVICIVGDVSRDSRSLLLARTLDSAGFTVSVAAACTAGEPGGDVTLYTWNDRGGRAAVRALRYGAWLRKQNIPTPRLIIAGDYFALSSAVSLARRTGARLLYDMREFNFALGPLAQRPLRQKFIEWSERRLLRHVDLITVSGPLDAKVVEERFHRKAEVILNVPPYQPAQRTTRLRDTFTIPSDDTIVLYQGVVHHGRGLEPFLRAMPFLPNVHLCVLGDGPAKRALQEVSRECGVQDRTHWHASVPYDELHSWTCSADLGLCLIEPISMSYEYALPNKLFEYMMAGIPSIVTDLPALHEMIMREPVGMLVNRTLSATDIVDAMTRIRQPITYEALQQRCVATKTYSYEGQSQHVLRVVSSVMD